MAVLDSHPGLSVQVISSGAALREYVGQVREEGLLGSVTKYLETDDFHTEFGVRIEVRLDGTKVRSTLYHASELTKEEGHIIKGAWSTLMEFRIAPGFFSPLSLSVRDTTRHRRPLCLY
jgi:hypothetical protein